MSGSEDKSLAEILTFWTHKYHTNIYLAPFENSDVEDDAFHQASQYTTESSSSNLHHDILSLYLFVSLSLSLSLSLWFPSTVFVGALWLREWHKYEKDQF